MNDLRKEKENAMARAIELAKIIYNNHCVGGHFHIVLDDGNLENRHIEWCINDAKTEEKDNDLLNVYLELGKILLNMTMSQRIKFYNKYDIYG
jgi:hypothetical protein